MARSTGKRSKPRPTARRGVGIRPRLAAIVLLPTLAALVLLAMRVGDTITDQRELSRIESVAASLPSTYALAGAITAERDAWALGGDTAGTAAATDKAAAEWRKQLRSLDIPTSSYLPVELNNLYDDGGDLESIRGNAAEPSLATAAYEAFSSRTSSLIGLVDYLDQRATEDSLAQKARALSSLGQALTALSAQSQIVLRSFVTDRVSDDSVTMLARHDAVWTLALEDLQESASSQVRSTITPIVGSVEARTLQTDAALLRETRDPAKLRSNAATWTAANASVTSRLLEIGQAESVALQTTAESGANDARWEAIITTLAAFLLLLFTLIAAILVARSIVRPLRSLSTAALDVARRGLAERVRLIESSDTPDRHTIVEPLGVPASGELSEVADAFDEVHARAVLLAAEQAKTRTNVQHMFVNLARRSQSLVDRQLRLIDELEEREQDPKQLASLFQLDHLATRMRRNDNSLMVLADVESSRTRRTAVPIVDVLRAASSEVDQYERVDLDTVETRAITGPVTDDLIHVLAELIENATNFSPPDTRVTLRAEQSAPNAPLVIEIEDNGIGMSPHELALANAKVRTLSELDAESARMMGLFVVARLARRHGLQVELRANEGRGVTTVVLVPSEHVTLLDDEPRPPVLQVVPNDTEPIAPATPPEPKINSLRSLVPMARDAAAPTSGPEGAGTEHGSDLPMRRPAAALELTAGPPSEDPVAEPDEAPVVAAWDFGPPTPLDAPDHSSAALAGASDDPLSRPFEQIVSEPEPVPVVDRMDAPATESVEAPSPEPVTERLPQRRPQIERVAELDAIETLDGSRNLAHLEGRPANLLTQITPRRNYDPKHLAPEAAQPEAPAYDALESEWFTRRLLPTPEELAARVAADAPAADWTSPGDDGWRVAAELTSEPAELDLTADGLPMRVPGRNLMPGSAEPFSIT